MQDFNRDVQRYAAQIALRRGVAAGRRDRPAAATARELDALFAASDWLAVHFRRRVRISLLCTHALAAAMGLAFILYSDVQANRIYVAIFLLVFVLGLAIRWSANAANGSASTSITAASPRAACVQFYWWLAGIDIPPGSSPATTVSCRSRTST